MQILLSNDDGIDAPGLEALWEALRDLGTLTVVAPHREQSASSHGFTMHNPLRMTERRPRWFAISGTPADCVYMGVHHVLEEVPALVVSGINRGTNIGSDIHYSGTVAAAMEAALVGIPSIAVSLEVRSEDETIHWETAGELTHRLARLLLEDPLPRHSFLNVNVPNRAPADLMGIKPTAMGRRLYHPLVSEHLDPRGKPYFWIGGAHQSFDPSEGTDGYWFERGYATITPLHPNLTDHESLRRIEGWPLDRTKGTT
jgi:5'-nucleotidase